MEVKSITNPACVPVRSAVAMLKTPKGRRVKCFGINVSLALALRGIIGAYHGERDRSQGVTCLTNPLKTPPRGATCTHACAQADTHAPSCMADGGRACSGERERGTFPSGTTRFLTEKKRPNCARRCNPVKAGGSDTYCMSRYCMSGALASNAHAAQCH